MLLVRVKGLEPPLPYGKQILSLPRLPFRHTRADRLAVVAPSWLCAPDTRDAAPERSCDATCNRRAGKTFAGRRSLKLRGDVMECGAEVGSDQLKRADRGNRDQGGNEAVFDRGSSAVVFNEPYQCGKHLPSPLV